MSLPYIISIANQKGGVGKTTTAVNLAHGLVQQEKKVLIIDLDAQGNCSSIFLDDENITEENSIYAVFKDKTDIGELVQKTRIRNLDLAAAALKLSDVESLLAGAVDGFFRLSEALAGVENQYDFVLIDCPPNLGMLTVNAFVCASHLLIPLQTAKFSLDGLTTILETASTIQKRFNQKFCVLGALITIHNQRTAISQAFIDPIAEYLNLFEARISRAVAVEEAHMMQQTIFEYQPKCRIATEYMQLTREVIDGVEKG